MASPTFVQLAGSLVEAMGQRLDAMRPIDEGLILRTNDGFVFAFLEDPLAVSLGTVRRLLADEGGSPPRLVVLSPGHLPLLLSGEVVKAGGTVVEGPRFAELARQLGLESLLGDAPRPRLESPRRLLPSAQLLDDTMLRARTWLDWGVPALALRFYRQAAQLKSEFAPAKVGVGRALLALGLAADAERLFDEVLADHPDDVEARLGRAAVLGAKARPQEEIAMYRKLLAEDEARTEVRAHLVAALVDLGDWRSARVEIEAMLARTPEDPQLRFLHAVSLERTGQAGLAGEEREESRRLGLPYEREVALCQHLGLPAPTPPRAKAGPTTTRPPIAAVPSGTREKPPHPVTEGPRRPSGTRPATRSSPKRAPRKSPSRKRK